jgi:hypothetical protein
MTIFSIGNHIWKGEAMTDKECIEVMKEIRGIIKECDSIFPCAIKQKHFKVVDTALSLLKEHKEGKWVKVRVLIKDLTKGGVVIAHHSLQKQIVDLCKASKSKVPIYFIFSDDINKAYFMEQKDFDKVAEKLGWVRKDSLPSVEDLYMGILWKWRKKYNIGYYTSKMDEPFKELAQALFERMVGKENV